MESSRVAVLRCHGASEAEIPELLGYTHNTFEIEREEVPCGYPLADEGCVASWEEYAAEAQPGRTLETLRKRLVQLCFPIAAGISQTPEYQAATRRGKLDCCCESRSLRLEEPERLELRIHETAAGRIPVLIAGTRQDFVSLLQALTRKNEPVPVPGSVGAMMVAGFNNWDRVRQFLRQWKTAHPGEGEEVGFRTLVPRKELYQDRFILLSRGPYSAVTARDLWLDEEEWARKSLIVRMEHESAHYFTRRVFGSMKNSLHDELMADYMGLVTAEGRFRADWFLRFMGVEDYPDYRPGGRLETYRGDPPLSDSAFRVLQSLIVEAARNLEAADGAILGQRTWSLGERAQALCGLAGLGLEEMASQEGPEILSRALRGTP